MTKENIVESFVKQNRGIYAETFSKLFKLSSLLKPEDWWEIQEGDYFDKRDRLDNDLKKAEFTIKKITEYAIRKNSRRKTAG